MKHSLDDICTMKLIRQWSVVTFLLLVLVTSSEAQKKNTNDSPELDKVKNMVGFLEYMLNTLGSEKTSSRDKDVLITESYAKIFRDSKVQIEDDLDTDRKVITNKDVPAYLKDVDFFFKDVQFEFTIEDITIGEQSDNNIFYLVSLLRNLRGTTMDGESVNNTMKRFIEVNYNPVDQDLKIVSIYTNEFDESAALTYWWNALSYEWQSIFKKEIGVIDTVQLSDLKRITSIQNIDLRGNIYIQDIAPLSQLYGLKSLNLSKTNIADLTPVRNLTELTHLDLSYTPVTDIASLRYSWKLSHLNLSHSLVTDVSVIEKMATLQQLNLSGTQLVNYNALRNGLNLKHLNLESSGIINLAPIDSMVNLEQLNLSGTAIVNLNILSSLSNVKVLHLDSIRVADITALKGMKNLEELYVNHTPISDLTALRELTQLRRIYCDHSGVNKSIAEAFMTARPEVLVIYDSEDLKSWWAMLSHDWRQLLQESARIGNNPTKEELARITKLDSINLSQSNIADLEPLRRFTNLKVVIASNTPVSDLRPLEVLKDITYLDVSHTMVYDLSAMTQWKDLRTMIASHTLIQNLPSDVQHLRLEKLEVDHTSIDDNAVRRFLDKNPQCLVVYKSDRLKQWWTSLSSEWKNVFNIQLGVNQNSTEALHQLVEGEELHFQDTPVEELDVLREFIRLKRIQFSSTRISNLSPLSEHRNLISVHATKSPVTNIEVVKELRQLEELNISNTPIDNIDVLENLSTLKKLDCSGTPLRRLNALENLSSLLYLDCSNTLVRNLNPVVNISLSVLKCYNTKISQRRIEEFQQGNPECEVTYY
ncbi:MAG: leucine-rich repeat domain-containing protein [Cyclobacteriaceae bacterium]